MALGPCSDTGVLAHDVGRDRSAGLDHGGGELLCESGAGVVVEGIAQPGLPGAERLDGDERGDGALIGHLLRIGTAISEPPTGPSPGSRKGEHRSVPPLREPGGGNLTPELREPPGGGCVEGSQVTDDGGCSGPGGGNRAPRPGARVRRVRLSKAVHSPTGEGTVEVPDPPETDWSRKSSRISRNPENRPCWFGFARWAERP